MTFSNSLYARSERGQMYVTVTGSGGRIEEVQLTTEYVDLTNCLCLYSDSSPFSQIAPNKKIVN